MTVHPEAGRRRASTVATPSGPRHLPGGTGHAPGFTLLELLIALTIGVVVLGLVMTSLAVFLRTGYNGVALAQSNDKANVVFTEIGQQVVGADIVFNPTTEGTNAGTGIAKGFSLRVLSTASGRTTCVQWRVVEPTPPAATEDLEVRSWPNGEPTRASSWSTLVTGLVNATTKPFALPGTTAYGGRLLEVDLVFRAAGTSSSATTEFQSSFDAANAEFFSGTHSQFCTPVPAP